MFRIIVLRVHDIHDERFIYAYPSFEKVVHFFIRISFVIIPNIVNLTYGSDSHRRLPRLLASLPIVFFIIHINQMYSRTTHDRANAVHERAQRETHIVL